MNCFVNVRSIYDILYMMAIVYDTHNKTRLGIVVYIASY